MQLIEKNEMSTKASLAHGPNFHLYEEVFDDKNIYLELEGVVFEASSNGVTVAIPLEIWEVIREHTNANFSYADKSDEEIQQEAEKVVQERGEAYAKADSKNQARISLSGGIIYGSADEPRENQIAKGIDHFRKLRYEQQKLRGEIDRLKRKDR